MNSPLRLAASTLLITTVAVVCLAGRVESSESDAIPTGSHTFGHSYGDPVERGVRFASSFSGPDPWKVYAGSIAQRFAPDSAQNEAELKFARLRANSFEERGSEASALPEDERIGSIPEPTPLLMMATGFIGMWGWLRRKKVGLAFAVVGSKSEVRG